MFKVSFVQALKQVECFPWRRVNSSFLLVSALLSLVQWFVWASYRVRFVLHFLFVSLFVFPLRGKAEWGGTPVCWWLGLYFCFVCCLDEASCTGCCLWLGDAGSCIQVVSFVWILSIWYSLGLFPEKAMEPHSSTLAWKIPWTEEPSRLQSMGSLRVGHDWATSLSRIGEGNGNPLQYSCLENPRDRGACWAAIYGVSQSQTLKWLSSSSSSRVSSLVV